MPIGSSSTYERIPRWGIYLIYWGLPLASLPSGFDTNVGPKFVWLRLVLTLVAASYLIASFSRGRLTLRLTRLDLPLQSLVVATMLSAVFSLDFRLSLWGSWSRYDGFLTQVLYVLVYLVTVNFVDSGRTFLRLVEGSVAVAAAVGAYGVLQVVTLSESAGGFFRPWATFGGPDWLGGYLALMAPLALALAAIKMRRSLDWGSLTWVLPCLVIVSGLALTLARAAWAGAVAGLVLAVCLMVPGTLWRKLVYSAATLLAIALIGVLVAVASGHSAILSQRAGDVIPEDRMVIWGVTTPMIKARPALGSGPDTYGLVFPSHRPENWYRIFSEGDRTPDKAHNEALQVAATRGMIGLLAGLWWVLAVLGFVSRAILSGKGSKRVMLAGLLGSLVAYLIQLQASFTEPSVAPFFWVTTALAMRAAGGLGNAEVTWVFWEKAPRRPMRTLMTVAVIVMGVGLAASPLRHLVSNVMLGRADSLNRAGRYSEAIGPAKLATDTSPDEEFFYRILGDNYLLAAVEDYRQGRGRPEGVIDAIEAYKAAYRLSPREPEISLLLADAYRAGGEMTDRPEWNARAMRYYRNLLRLDPNSTEAHLKLGLSLKQAGRVREATDEWKVVLALNPKEANARSLLTTVEATKEDPAFGR